ncbi:MAG: (2Fe-2S)-binding protein [bacterium]|nr:(2Fe-2S)-binding protein [bacterium]
MSYTLHINGQLVSVQAPGTARLLDVLREELGLTGTKEGCGEGECGACAVHMDGQLVNACLVLVCQAEGHEITTIEGVAAQARWRPLFDAFVECGAVQCGFCMPGMVMAAAALLRERPRPSEAEIVRGLSGNLCRCTGYRKIITAVQRAGERIASGS